MNVVILTLIISVVCLSLFIMTVYALYKLDMKPKTVCELFYRCKLIWVVHPAGSRYTGSLEESHIFNDYSRYYRYLRNWYSEHDLDYFLRDKKLHKIDKNKYSLDIWGDKFVYEVIY